MKKILFATTALVATAGVAAADVNFGGYGRFGMGYNDGNENNKTYIESRFRMNIDASAESDGGVGFSARVRMQADDDGKGEAGKAGLNGANFGITYGGLQVVVGNIAGAIDNMNGYFGAEPGLSNFVGQYSGNDFGFTGYSSTGSGVNGVFLGYEIAGLVLGASYDQDDKQDDVWDVAAAYTFADAYTVALGYGKNGVDEDMSVLTFEGAFGNFVGTLMVGDETVADAAKSGMFYGLSGALSVGAATTITASYGDGEGDADTEQYGLGFIQDLGGGTSLRGGVGKDGDDTVADLGVRFNF